MASTGSSTSADVGRLILRLALGVLILMHGIDKVMSGPAGLVGLVEKSGLPGFVAYGVYVGEVIAPLMLIAGWWTRLAALVVAVNMVVAVALVHMDDLLALTNNGGWALELQAMYLFTALAVALLGAGRFSVGGARGRFN
ncbi:MAG: DoxX family protein [Betaproteobacteria bacterium]|nr:MAG: DoxX family protein [Betaproteobacteria bacterium]